MHCPRKLAAQIIERYGCIAAQGRFAIYGLLILVLSACGGSGSDPGPAPDADFNLTLTPTADKLFRFSWADVSGETEYRLLENPDGSSGYTQVATIPANTTSYDFVVFLPERFNASYILQACDSGGCSDSNEVLVTGSLAAAVGVRDAPNAGSDDRFGFSVALSGDGNTLAVGAYLEDSGATGVCAPGDAGCTADQADNSAEDSGAVYVFSRNGNAWSLQAYVKALNAEAGDQFGTSVALSDDGDTLAVGASEEESNATGVCASGDTGCVTAQGNNANVGSGAAYVFTRSAGTWSEQAYLKASNTEVNDRFGSSLVLSGSGTTLAVASIFEDGNGISQGNDDVANSGAVYVFTGGGSSWSQQAYVKATNPGANDRFGSSLAISDDGNTLAVGAFLEDSDVTGVCPPAFECDTTNDNDLSSDSGAVYLFTRSGSTWSIQVYVKASNTQSGDQFGRSVALSDDGDVMAIGVYGEASGATGIGGDQADNTISGSGAVFVYSRSGVNWFQDAYIKASNPDVNDHFGGSVALSGDGRKLVVGAASENSIATGIEGTQTDNSAQDSGAAYLFTESGGIWSHQAYLKAPDTQDQDRFGTSLALADDGSTLAVGAPKQFTDQSAVYLY